MSPDFPIFPFGPIDPIKVECIYLPPPCHRPHGGEQPSSKTHPSWAAGIESLHAYNHWVNSILLPIAFQWIEEHKPDVYATVPDELRDDVGVVIAAAFNLVKGLSAYQAGLARRADVEAAVTAGTFDASTVNPVWSGITEQIQTATEAAFAAQSAVLGETIG